MATDFVEFGAVFGPWADSVTGAQIAFGSIATPGVTTPFTVTGAATIYVYGGWTRAPHLTIERSADGGTTWGPAGNIEFNGSTPANVAAVGSLTGNPQQTGTALYRLRLEMPTAGGPFSWAVYQ